MKIDPHHIIQFGQTALETFGEGAWQRVAKCRQIVGYQENRDWVCPYLGDAEHQEAFRAQYPGKRIGGFLCHPCFVKEARDWISRGWITSAELAEDSLKETCLRSESLSENPVAY